MARFSFRRPKKEELGAPNPTECDFRLARVKGYYDQEVEMYDSLRRTYARTYKKGTTVLTDRYTSAMSRYEHNLEIAKLSYLNNTARIKHNFGPKTA